MAAARSVNRLRRVLKLASSSFEWTIRQRAESRPGLPLSSSGLGPCLVVDKRMQWAYPLRLGIVVDRGGMLRDFIYNCET